MMFRNDTICDIADHVAVHSLVLVDNIAGHFHRHLGINLYREMDVPIFMIEASKNISIVI